MKPKPLNQHLLLLFILTILILMNIPYSVRTAGEQTDYLEDFEDDILTQQSEDDYYGSLWINSYTTEADSYVFNTPAIGDRSYRNYRNDIVYFNLTYDSLYRWETISFRVYLEGFNTNLDRYIYLRNSTGSNIIGIEIGGNYAGNNELSILELTVWTKVADDIAEDEFLWFNLTYNSIDTFDLDVNLSDGTDFYSDTGIPVNIVSSDYNITQIRVNTNQDLANADTYYDNIEIELEIPTDETGGDAIPSCSPDSTLGSIGNSQGYFIVQTTYINTKYDAYTTGYIHRLDFEIQDIMVDFYGATVDKFQAKINDEWLGIADEMIQIGAGDNYRVTWTGLNIFINNSIISVSIKNDDSSNIPFVLPYTKNDNLDDGHCKMSAYTSTAYWNNHGSLTNLQAYPTQVFTDREFLIRMCFETDSTWEFNDDLENDVESFASGSCTNSTQINIDWFLNSSAMAYINQLWIDTPSLAPYVARNITTQTGHIWFTPKETGTFYFNLSTNGVNHSTDSETITCSDTTNWLYTVPNPSGETPIAVFYNYTSAYDGCIRVFDSQGNRIDMIYVLKGTHSFTYNIPDERHTVFYFRLCTIREVGNNIVYQEVYSYVHCVQGYIINYIEVETALGVDRTLEYTETGISGEHSHLSKDVWIYIGASKFKSVSSDEHFTKYWIPDKQGTYLIRLRIHLPSGKIITLAETTVTVVDKDALTTTPLLPTLDVTLGYLLGSIFVFVFTLLPMLILGFLGHTRQQIPNIVYVMSGGVGVVIVTGIGWWDFWASFFILAIGFMMLLGMYFIGKKS